MKVPLSWLKEFVSCEAAPEEIAERLTFAGLEVESVERVGSDFKNVVVGEVLSVRPHPNAERLTLCEVATGAETVRVVCGAPNAQVGGKFPFALVGAVLPNGQKIKSATIRGEASHGMLCAEDELGFSQDHAALMQLPRAIPAGTPFSEVAGGPEAVLAIAVTPNRSDCLSIVGIAREVAALYGLPLKLPTGPLAETGAPAGKAPEQSPNGGSLRVVVEDPEGCPRYTARLLRNVAIGPSSPAMRLRLLRCGFRPINVIVDITNYVMLEYGQPLHAFDLALLAEQRLVVRRARPGETLATLDGMERKLNPEMLVIADHQAPVALAGIMGGIKSGISESTREVVLESASFQPALIRRTSKALGLSSESSYRFERGVDIRGVDFASRRAAALMVEHAGAAIAPGAVDCFPVEPKERKIICRFDRVRGLLGVGISDNEITSLLEALALPIVDRSKKSCTVQAPTFRPDLEAEVDLIEEVSRLYGLDKIPSATSAIPLLPGLDDAFIRATITCREALVGLGLTEIINYSLVSEKLLMLCDSTRTKQRIVLPHPVSAEEAALRDGLLPQMIATLGRNRARQIMDAAFFEIGRVFFQNEQKTYTEEEHLAIGLMGAAGRTGLGKSSSPGREGLAVASAVESFLWLKGILEALGHKLLIRVADRPPGKGQRAGLAFRELSEATELPAFYNLDCITRNRGVVITLDGEPCGIMGLVRETLSREWRLYEDVAVLEMRLTPLLERLTAGAGMPEGGAVDLPVYPSVARDIALRLPLEVQHGAIVSTIWKIAPKELTAVELFDIYTGDEIGVGYKSMAYTLTYRSPDRTLTDEEVNRLHQMVKDRLRSELAVEIREG